jgi:hypothetical protein
LKRQVPWSAERYEDRGPPQSVLGEARRGRLTTLPWKKGKIVGAQSDVQDQGHLGAQSPSNDNHIQLVLRPPTTDETA